MLRDLRRADGPAYLEMLERGFPEESVLLGNRREEFEKIFRRVFRWDTRILLFILGAFGRPMVRALVVEADGRAVATTLVTFPTGAAYVSNVVVDPAYRRRGYARQMLAEALTTARRAKRKYVVLDVLESNTGARALYDSLGYLPLQSRAHLLHNATGRFAQATEPNPSIRPMRRSDASALVEISRRQTPPEVEKVIPTRKHHFVMSGIISHMLGSEDAAWVLDRGHGPEAHVAAAVSRASEAGHLTAPTLSESVDDRLAVDLVATAVAWCAARGVPRILTMVSDHNPRGRAALEAVGFHDARPLWTLYRNVD
ncbi:MAG TPA: GNAT family N-acetyltransferase [Thermoplasmata archaeon]|nr:GNAT family N-acetyltransferase [Thermoplasmata archaeon]